VLGAQRLEPDREGLFEEPQRLLQLALQAAQPGHVVVRGAHVFVLRPQHLEPDREGPLEELLSYAILALGLERIGHAPASAHGFDGLRVVDGVEAHLLHVARVGGLLVAGHGETPTQGPVQVVLAGVLVGRLRPEVLAPDDGVQDLDAIFRN